MANPQQPELRRSERNEALSPDATEARQDVQRPPSTTGDHGPVPESNRAGHHDEHDQDKPDLDAFAERLGIVPDDAGPDEDSTADGPAADVAAEGLERPPATTEERRPSARRRAAVATSSAAGGPPGWAVVARAGALVVLEPWIVAGRLAERARDAIERSTAPRSDDPGAWER